MLSRFRDLAPADCPILALRDARLLLAGATIAARILPHLSNRHVRLVFLPVLIVIGLQTLARGFGIGL